MKHATLAHSPAYTYAGSRVRIVLRCTLTEDGGYNGFSVHRQYLYGNKATEFMHDRYFNPDSYDEAWADFVDRVKTLKETGYKLASAEINLEAAW